MTLEVAELEIKKAEWPSVTAIQWKAQRRLIRSPPAWAKAIGVDQRPDRRHLTFLFRHLQSTSVEVSAFWLVFGQERREEDEASTTVAINRAAGWHSLSAVEALGKGTPNRAADLF